VNVLPWPSSLATATSPPDCLAKPNTWDRPSPVPVRPPWCEEGLEDAAELLLRNADAGILDRDRDVTGGVLAWSVLVRRILRAQALGYRALAARLLRLGCGPGSSA